MQNKIRSEESIQAECFTWFWTRFPAFRGTMFAVPNGGARNRAEAARMKSTGTVSGTSDLVWARSKGRVVFIEMKNEIGMQSKEQEEFEKILILLGHEYVVIRSVAQFKEFVLNKLSA
jgi:hypothetical protein